MLPATLKIPDIMYKRNSLVTSGVATVQVAAELLLQTISIQTYVFIFASFTCSCLTTYKRN